MTEREVTLLRDFITWQSLPFVDNIFSTRDETIKHFNEWLIQVSGNQQPCEDCISREEAINEADNLSLETSYDNEKVEQMLRDLPSVKPKYTDEAQPMRDATEEERKSVKDYIESVSKPTGVQFEAQPTDAKETIIKSALKYLVKMQIEEGSAGFAVDNDHDHDCCWDDVLAWIEAQPSEDAVSREAVETFKEALIDKLAYTGYTEEYKDEIIDIINQMPSVTPKYTDEEIDKIQAVEQAYVDKMVELAVEELRREWLNSFDTSSATKCFEAVNLLKERLKNET